MPCNYRVMGRDDFDFLHGDWDIVNKVRSKWLCGNDEWYEYPASLSVRSILGGLGNVDDFKAKPKDKELLATTLRLFNPETELWSIYWVDTFSMVLQPPVFGKFTGDEGIFEGDDTFAGRPIRAKFVWTKISADRALWRQDFAEPGEDWETNWIMEFTRSPNSRT